MTWQITPTNNQLVVCLVLADGSSWNIAAGDVRASEAVLRLMDAMQLTPVADASLPFKMAEPVRRFPELSRRLNVLVDPNKTAWNILPCEDHGIITCIIGSAHCGNLFFLQLIRLSHLLIKYAEVRGAVLLHGALIERDGSGVILAGPGGAGKTTAARRLVSPWRPLCDDSTLVVCDQNGAFWAHPWPTWSCFLYGGTGGSWDVQYSVPLEGIFFLEQAKEENFEPLGVAQAACLLIESAEQTSWPLSPLMKQDELRIIRLKRFENICNMIQAVPSFVLRLGLNGPFWREIERALDLDD
jgi:SynChlorMet cassette protein ScmC